MKTIGDVIHELRTQKGLSPFDLSIKSLVPEANIRNWEAGRRTPSDVLALTRVARALGTTVDKLAKRVERR